MHPRESGSSRLPLVLMICGGVLLILAAVRLLAGGASEEGADEQAAVANPCAFPACRAAATLALARGFEGPSVEVDPRDPKHIVVTDANMTSAHCTFHVTFDGGRAWTDGVFEVPPGYTGCHINRWSGGHVPTGPSGVAFGPSGTVYATFGSALAEDGSRESVMLATSADGGKSFKVGVASRPPGDEIGFARPEMAVTTSPGGGADRVLVSFWQCGQQGRICDQALFIRSDDGGATFTPPLIVNGPPGGQNPSPPIQAPDGTIYLTFTRSGTIAELFLARSTDSGGVFSSTLVESQPGIGDQYDPAKLAVDPRSGTLYAVYTDARTGRQQVIFRKSEDKGNTWSAPIGLSPDQAAAGAARSPTISVAPNGRIDIAYYRSRTSGIDDVFSATSNDGGVRFVHRQVNDAPIRRTKYTEAIGNWYPPDVASLDDAALVAWSDTKNADQISNTQDVLLRRMLPAAGEPPP